MIEKNLKDEEWSWVTIGTDWAGENNFVFLNSFLFLELRKNSAQIQTEIPWKMRKWIRIETKENWSAVLVLNE